MRFMKWIEGSTEEELSSELKVILKEIIQNFQEYEELEELLRKYKNAKLTEKEREKLDFIINKFLNKYPIHLQLYYNLSGFKAYFQEQHWWNPWLIREIKYKFLNHLSKKYEILNLDSQFSQEEINFFKNHGIDWRLLKSRWAWVKKKLLIPFFLEVLYAKSNNIPKIDDIENWGYGRFLKILRENYDLTLSKLVEEAGKTPRKSLKTEKDFSDDEKQFLISKNVNLENLNTRWEWVRLDPQLAIDFYKEVLFPKFSRCPTTREIKKLGYAQFIEILRNKGITISNLAERAGFRSRQSYEKVLNSDDLTDKEVEFLERYNIKFSDLTSRWSWLDDNPDLAINFFKEVIYPLYNKVPTWNEIAISKYYNFIQKLSSFNLTYPELIKLSGFEPNYEFLNEDDKMIINDLMERFESDYFESDQEITPPSLSYIIKYGLFKISDVTFGKYAKLYLINKFGVQEGEKIYSQFWPNLSSGLSDEKKSKIYNYTEKYVNDFLDSNNQNKPPPIIHIIKFLIPNISNHTFSKYAQEYLNKRFGFIRGQNLYEKMWPYDFLAAKTGTLVHRIINEFLTIYLKNFQNIKYFSTPAVYPTRKPDGLILKSKKLLLLLKSNNDILKKLHLDLDILNRVKALVFDFTSDVSQQNIVNKILKYQHPEIFLFIIGYRWYDSNVYLKIPDYRGIIDKKKIKIISIENLWKLFSIPLDLRQELKKTLMLAIDRDIDSLSDISFLENEELYNTDSLRVELIQNGKIEENIQEYLDLGLITHPIKNIFTKSELEYIENCKKINHKIAIIDIETTGFNPLKDSIIEIGIVELDLKTGEKKILFNSVVKDPNYNLLKCYNNPFLKDISIDPIEIENAKLLEFYRDILQLIFNSYKTTAYNSKFDFRFLENRGFKIPRKLMDVMKFCRKLISKENSLKFEEIYRHFYNTPQNESKKILTNSNYVSIHRAIDDAIHETELLYYLILEYIFPLNYQKSLSFKEK